MYSSSLDSSSSFSLSALKSVCSSDASTSVGGPVLADYFLLPDIAVASVVYSRTFSSSLVARVCLSLDVEESLLLSPRFIFFTCFYTIALLAANGLTNNLVKPSRLTAGDFFLQCGHVVVITYDHISLINPLVRFYTVVLHYNGAELVITNATFSSMFFECSSLFSSIL